MSQATASAGSTGVGTGPHSRFFTDAIVFGPGNTYMGFELRREERSPLERTLDQLIAAARDLRQALATLHAALEEPAA